MKTPGVEKRKHNVCLQIHAYRKIIGQKIHKACSSGIPVEFTAGEVQMK